MTYVYLVTAEVKPAAKGDWKTLTGLTGVYPVCAFLDRETADRFVAEVRAAELKMKGGVVYAVQAVPRAETVDEMTVAVMSCRRAIALGGVTVNQAKEAK